MYGLHGIVISHCKDPYEPISITECQSRVSFHAHITYRFVDDATHDSPKGEIFIVEMLFSLWSSTVDKEKKTVKSPV